jgi:hypothetical protein
MARGSHRDAEDHRDYYFIASGSLAKARCEVTEMAESTAYFSICLRRLCYSSLNAAFYPARFHLVAGRT